MNDKITKILEQYYELHKEKTNILNEIKNVRNSYKKNLKYIDDKMVVYSNEILRYLEENNLPGVEYKKLNFIAENRKVRNSQKQKKTQIMNLLDKYNIFQTHPLRNEIENMDNLKPTIKKIKIQSKK
tara:strand:+ start:1947 stop:2327 length:381 start_codon:yes stop_codon:yes gene_type:complete